MNDLVLLHAAASGPATWADLTPPLAALGYRVHTPTLLGHQSAPRRRTYTLDAFRDDVLAQLGHLDTFALVGHSLGAFVASTIAVADPARVTHLVLEELPAPPRTAEDAGPSARRTPAFFLHVLGRLSRASDPRVLHDAVTALRTPSPAWWQELPTVTAPTLLLTGGPSSHLDQSRFREVAAALPTVTTAEIPVGHRIHTKAPGPWLDAVRSHLTTA